MTPEKWRDHYNNSSSSHETFDSSCKSEVNGSESRSNTSSPCAVRSSQEGRKSRVVKRILSSDSEPGRENGLPDYVTFVPDTPTKADSYQSPFFYSETYPTTTTTATTRMCTMSDASSNSGGIQMSSNSGISCVTSTTCTTGDASSFLSGNSDAVSSSTSTDDPKWYIKRLLKQHYHLGNISAYQYWRILERASRRVEQGQVMAKYTDKSRIRRLVDDYVEAYINAAAKFNAE